MTALRLFYPGAAPQGQTLDDVYAERLPTYDSSMSDRSKVEQRTALKHWREGVGAIEVTAVKRDTIVRFREHLVGTGMSAATINKVWRTLRALFRFAHEELKWIDAVPTVAYGQRSKLVDADAPLQREILSHAEIAQLWSNCAEARYPIFEPCLTWRTFLVMQWAYGMRTSDLIELPKTAILQHQKLVRWVADKTTKLQGLPLIEVAEWHLQRWLAIAPEGPRLFAGLARPGHFNHRTNKTSPGYYTEWNQVISRGVEPRVLIKNLRQAMVTELNDTGHGEDIGGWAAGHSPVGVTQRNYDNPSARVRKAFLARPVPPCFLEGVAHGSRCLPDPLRQNG